MITPLDLRDPASLLALSSRNAYLKPLERELIAPSLYQALMEGKRSWEAGLTKSESIQRAQSVIERKIQDVVNDAQFIDKPTIKLDYIEMNDPVSFDVLVDETTKQAWGGSEDDERPVILSGALWVGKTRLIDNVILGDEKRLGIVCRA